MHFGVESAVGKIARSLAKPENHYWIALLNGMPTGYAKLKLPSGHKVPGNEGAAQLQKIYVLAEFKANRLGHALMQAVMAQAAGGGASTIWLTVLDTNEPAIRFYRRCGWRDAGTATFTIGSLRFSYLVLDCDVVCSVP